MRKKRLSIMAIFALILSLGIGYAAIQTTLTINGNTKISGNSWDIHFENLQVADGSVDGTTRLLDAEGHESTTATTVEFAADLTQPGQFYEFTIDVVNKGTIDAAIYEVDATNFDEIEDSSGKKVSKYLDYQIYYLDENDDTYNGRLPAVKDTLYKKDSANDTRRIKVRVKYKDGKLDNGEDDPNWSSSTDMPEVDSLVTTDDSTGETTDNRIKTYLTLKYTQLGYECKFGTCEENTP